MYAFNFTSLSIIGEGDVIFSGLFGMSFELDLKNTFVHVKGIHFDSLTSCRHTSKSDTFNPGVLFLSIETLVFEECTVRYGGSLFVRVQNLTVDSCTFSDFNSVTLPVLASWVYSGLTN